MKMISTTEARKKFSNLINHVRETGEVFAIGRRKRPEALLMKFPEVYNDITNVNATSASFDFWDDEPDLYTLDDAKELYV